MDSDPDIEFIEKDSGMSSLGGSKDETPERRAFIVRIEHIVDMTFFSSPSVLHWLSFQQCTDDRFIFERVSNNFIYFLKEDIEDEHEEREEREESGVVMELGPRGDAPEPTETYDDVSELYKL